MTTHLASLSKGTRLDLNAKYGDVATREEGTGNLARFTSARMMVAR